MGEYEGQEAERVSAEGTENTEAVNGADDASEGPAEAAEPDSASDEVNDL